MTPMHPACISWERSSGTTCRSARSLREGRKMDTDRSIVPCKFKLGSEPLVLEMGSEDPLAQGLVDELLDGEKLVACFRTAEYYEQIVITSRRLIITDYNVRNTAGFGLLSLPLRQVEGVSWNLGFNSCHREDRWGSLVLQFPRGVVELRMQDAARLQEISRMISDLSA